MRIGSFALVVATLTATLVFALLLRGSLQAEDSPSAYASARAFDPVGRAYQNGNTNANDNADNDDGDNDDADNEDDDNEDDDNDDFDNEDFDNDDFDFDLGPLTPPPPTGPSIQPQQVSPVCSTPGRESQFVAFGQAASLRIPASSSVRVRGELLPVINAHEAPRPPGEFVSPHVYEVIADSCDPVLLTTLPAGTTLVVRYTDGELLGMDENRLMVGRLDMRLAQWIPVDRRVIDTGANTVTAIITEPGYYMVWVER